MCTVCGRLRCSRCVRTHVCCVARRHVQAGAFIANTVGTAILACPRGCTGPPHPPSQCLRPRPPDSADVHAHGAFCVSFAKGRIKVLAAATDRAEVWQITATGLDGVKTQKYAVLGPALPGSIIATNVPGNAHRIKTLAACRVDPCGGAWVPRAAFAGVSRDAWRALAASQCAWARVVTRRGSARGQVASVPPHARMRVGEFPVAQLPPAHTTTARGTIVCCYCRRAFGSVPAYTAACAPDATICHAVP